MTAFLLDTCVLSETSKTKPHPAVVEFLTNADDLCIPVATIMEIQLGIMECCKSDPHRAVKLSAWYQKVRYSGINILPTTPDIADVWGSLVSDDRLRGLIVGDKRAKKPRNGQDIHIAAVAIVHKLAIATFNVRDFELINMCHPLPGIYNPQDQTWSTRPKALQFFEPVARPIVQGLRV